MNERKEPFVLLSGMQLNLPSYTGKGDDLSFPRWFNGCRDEMKAFGFQNEEQMSLLLARQLKGNARQAYDALMEGSNSGFSDLKTFYDTFSVKFVDDNFDMKLRHKLLSLKQSGSISKYIEDEKDLFGSYNGMKDKDRIFYLMHNMKATYVNILNKNNPATYSDAIDLLIQKGDLIAMNANITGVTKNWDEMDIDVVQLSQQEELGINLVSIDQGGKTFWVTIKESIGQIPLSTSNIITRTFMDKNKMCWNCGSRNHLRRDCTSSDTHWRRKPNFKNTQDKEGKDKSQE
ncbi:hypothetical protein AYI69_g1334 [Smittium culicis]|uniref:CCHC-type domain-containing protein n=1 Tax=Smittium culicis TaxID=133412 RepID=A0A1R1YQQ1_9FUNG|nr:hypothetical protein AYI69_g1334 [Smittium culicis]